MHGLRENERRATSLSEELWELANTAHREHRTSCFPPGTPSHPWQWTGAFTSSFAHKGMMRAARTLTRTSLRLITNKNALTRARQEFEEATKDGEYVSPLPDGLGPFDYFVPIGQKNRG
jgi:aminobenzoyl-glutamate utilization protein B